MFHQLPEISPRQRQSHTEKPNTIREVSSQITSTGEDGVEVIEEKSVYHDDFQVYRSTAYKKKIKWLGKLKNNKDNKNARIVTGYVTAQTGFAIWLKIPSLDF